MSNLLDDALIDAEALRETALKNAEAILLEKFSDQIKDAVETILLEAPEEEEMLGAEEEEDPMAAGGEELGGDLGAEEEIEVDIEGVPDAPLANAEGVKMCPCPDDEEIVTIDFDELEKQVQAVEAGEEIPSEEAAEEMPLEEEIEIDHGFLEEMAGLKETASIEEDLLEELAGALEENWIDSPESEEAEGEEAAEEKSEAESSAATTPQDAPYELGEGLSEEELLEELIETLRVDMSPQKSGWAGTPESIVQLDGKELVAMLQDSEHRERHDELVAAVKKLEESNKKLGTTTKKLKSDKKELLSLANKMKNKLYESNLTNSRLLYANKVLMSNSLNERQKTKIVEALSNAESVEETKVIYETLHSATGSTTNVKEPKSLSEAVTRTTSTMILSRLNKKDREENLNESSTTRWQILAGLNKTT